MKIQIIPFQATWASDFEFYRDIIQAHSIHQDIAIEHIGSTAIMGMSAKPIIDILVGVSSLAQANLLAQNLHDDSPFCYVPAFEDMIPNRRYLLFLPNFDGLPIKNAIALEQLREKDSCHIHICVKGSQFWDKHLAFRKFLNRNKHWADQYAHLKNVLSKIDFEYRAQYNICKASLIKTITNLALSEHHYDE